jgi:hypothetical protein
MIQMLSQLLWIMLIVYPFDVYPMITTIPLMGFMLWECRRTRRPKRAFLLISMYMLALEQGFSHGHAILVHAAVFDQFVTQTSLHLFHDAILQFCVSFVVTVLWLAVALHHWWLLQTYMGQLVFLGFISFMSATFCQAWLIPFLRCIPQTRSLVHVYESIFGEWVYLQTPFSSSSSSSSSCRVGKLPRSEVMDDVRWRLEQKVRENAEAISHEVDHSEELLPPPPFVVPSNTYGTSVREVHLEEDLRKGTETDFVATNVCGKFLWEMTQEEDPRKDSEKELKVVPQEMKDDQATKESNKNEKEEEEEEGKEEEEEEEENNVLSLVSTEGTQLQKEKEKEDVVESDDVLEHAPGAVEPHVAQANADSNAVFSSGVDDEIYLYRKIALYPETVEPSGVDDEIYLYRKIAPETVEPS